MSSRVFIKNTGIAVLVLAFVLLCLFAAHATASAQENDDEADDDPVVRTGPLSLESTQLTAIGNSFDSAGGVSGQSSLTITLNLFDDTTYTGIIEHVETTDSGYAAWGRLDGVALGTVTLVVNGDLVAGTVRSPLGVYDISMAADGSYVVSEIDESKLPPLLPPSSPDDDAEEEQGPSGASLSSSSTSTATSTATTTDDGSVIDVMVVYTPQVIFSVGGEAAFRTRMDLWQAEANQALSNSGAIPRIDIVHLHKTSYTSSFLGIRYDRDRLRGTSDGDMDEVHALRDTYAADLVHLIGDAATCRGVSMFAVTRSTGQQPTGDASSGFAVTDLSCPGFVFAHELGHNFGLHHDRYALWYNPPNDAAYAYGVGYVNQRAFDAGATSSSRWRTVMAYNSQCSSSAINCPRVLYFSNPEISHPVSGDPMGIPATATTTGILGPSDAQLALDNTSPIVAAFRESSTRCDFELSATSTEASSSGGSFSVGVTTRDGCAWTVQSHAWFATTNATSSAGSATTTFTVGENLGEERTGVVSVAGKSFLVTQAAADDPIYTDYDTDDDGLIEVSWLEQLDAVRYDSNGDGAADNSGMYPYADAYDSAFRYPRTNMGCPADTGCAGYELAKDLDFQDPASYRSATTSVPWTDTGRLGWIPIRYYNSTFDGGRHTISNLFSKVGGLFGTLGGSGRVHSLGLSDVRLETKTSYIGALASDAGHASEIAGVFVTGSVRGRTHTGGLVGFNSGRITASYSEASVAQSISFGYESGGLVGSSDGVISHSYATGNVQGGSYVGGLVGSNYGSVSASYATGNVVSQYRSGEGAGGLAGRNKGSVSASYATGDVECRRSVGGLVGLNDGSIRASYATGGVSGTTTRGSLIGKTSGTVAVVSYWNTETSGASVGVGMGTTTNVVGKTTAELQAPTGYSGIYADWNIDIDNADGDDDPTTGTDDVWDFGSSSDYPALKLVDYDTDDDGLIEITHLEQLDILRWDLDGNGIPDFPDGTHKYRAAFPDPFSRMGCPESGCVGYELARDLDFEDPDSYLSGEIYDDWVNRGHNYPGWRGIGWWSAVLEGNHHTISNLWTRYNGLIKVLNGPDDDVPDVIKGPGGEVRNLGLVNAEVDSIFTWPGPNPPYDHLVRHSQVGALVGRIINGGIVRNSYATGSVSAGNRVGGLVGGNESGTIESSYASVTVTGITDVGGLLGWNGDGGSVSHVYATGDVSGSGDNRGGLIGRMNSGGTLSAGYSTGEVSGTGSNLGGLIGSTAGTVSVVSYWDTEASGTTTGLGDGTSAKVVGKTTTELKSPTGYSGIYSTWDDDGSDHWDFGSASDYPVLKGGR